MMVKNAIRVGSSLYFFFFDLLPSRACRRKDYSAPTLTKIRNVQTTAQAGQLDQPINWPRFQRGNYPFLVTALLGKEYTG